MEHQSGYISWSNHPSNHPPDRPYAFFLSMLCRSPYQQSMCAVPPSKYLFSPTPIVSPIKKVCAVFPLPVYICFFLCSGPSPNVFRCLYHTNICLGFKAKSRISKVPACQFSCQSSPACISECGTPCKACSLFCRPGCTSKDTPDISICPLDLTIK